MRVALRYEVDGSADRMAVFAADLRRLRQVKCGNQFALPAGLLGRILMNLSLRTHTHTNNPNHTLTRSLKHTFQLFPWVALAGRNEKTLKAVCTRQCKDCTAVPLDTSKLLWGKIRWKSNLEYNPSCTALFEHKHAHVDTLTAINQTRTCATTHRYRCIQGKHSERNTWAVTHINTQGERDVRGENQFITI